MGKGKQALLDAISRLSDDHARRAIEYRRLLSAAEAQVSHVSTVLEKEQRRAREQRRRLSKWTVRVYSGEAYRVIAGYSKRTIVFTGPKETAERIAEAHNEEIREASDG